jgi:hypothetical protein
VYPKRNWAQNEDGRRPGRARSSGRALAAMLHRTACPTGRR